MSIISYGFIDKKLLLVVLITIFKIINNVIDNNYSYEYSNFYFSLLISEIGPILASIILYFKFKNKQKHKLKTKKNIKHIVILVIFRAIQFGLTFVTNITIPKNIEYNYSIILNSINGVEIIFISIATSLMLKYKYYAHHKISMIIYCLLGISIDFILKDFFILNYKYLPIFIIEVINEILLYCYIKYMLDKLYYDYIYIIFYWGIIGLIIKFCTISGFIIYQRINGTDEILNNINTYFNEINVAIIIFYQFIYLFLITAIYSSLIILLLYYLRPNHIIITDQIIVYLNSMLNDNTSNKWYTIIPFIFQILALFVYFEIIEINLWNLNKNTTKNILKREMEESEGEFFDNDNLEIDDQYYINADELNKIE